jgi:pimeloyl-ACP methyl ester carboxylesterase
LHFCCNFGRDFEEFADRSVLVVHPAVDPWTPAALSRPFFDRIAAEKYRVDLKRCGHLPYEEPGLHQMAEAISGFVSKVVEPDQLPSSPMQQGKD